MQDRRRGASGDLFPGLPHFRPSPALFCPPCRKTPDLDLGSSEGRKSWFVSKISGKHPHKRGLGVHGVVMAWMLSLSGLWLRK